MRKPIALAALMALAGCSDPLSGVPRLSEVAVDEPAPVVEAVAAPSETDDEAGFFQRMLRKREVGATGAVPGDDAQDAATAQADDATGAETVQVATDAQADAPRGLLGRLFGPGKARAVTAAGETPDRVERVALVQPDAGGGAEPQGRGGLFGTRKAARLTGPDARDAVPGEALGFGDVARACHVGRSELGTEVGKYPETGAKYRVYDSNPADPGLNAFYITGFADGCPRQVTAALAVFGSPGMYEALRYGLPESARTGRETDRAYEQVKSRVCGVSRNKPCGAKLGRLERDTVFLSVYNRFEGANGWINILIHDGRMLAMAPGG